MQEAVRRLKEREGASLPVGTEDRRRLISGLPPGLMSGLVCAGANLPMEDGRDNGLLTAAEISCLNLSGCELVMLSACRTALGNAHGGEGMLSVQRAFHVAGAKTVIATLWNVDDEATSQLVARFYTNLWRDDIAASRRIFIAAPGHLLLCSFLLYLCTLY